MTNKIWKMCVVALMVASPVMCSATIGDDIAAAVAAPGDGSYVEIGLGGSITLTLPTVPADGAVVLYLHGPSQRVRLQWGTDSEGYADYYDATYDGAWEVWVRPGTTSLTILGVPGYEDFVVYLDAVEVVGAGRGVYSSHDGPVTVLVDDPVTMIGNLIDLVTSCNLQQGIDSSLDAKLAAALDALEDVNANNDAAAINKLEAFISEVEAQRGKKISDDQADDLGAAAQAVIATLTMA